MESGGCAEFFSICTRQVDFDKRGLEEGLPRATTKDEERRNDDDGQALSQGKSSQSIEDRGVADEHHPFWPANLSLSRWCLPNEPALP